ncbi:MAG: type II secretion system F family protein [Verrucomicrobiota bacterium]|nr:type II secretion system F family protein [Verrucomicrobiota bacterium]
MAQFRYVARDSSGKLIEGVITANDRPAAMSQIESARNVPIRIEPMAEARGKKTKEAATEDTRPPMPVGTIQTISHNLQFLFTEQLAHLLGAGMTLDEGLGILVRRLKNPRLHSLSQSLHQSIIDGRSFSQAMRDYPKIFSPLYVNMVSAGEASGALPEILRRLTVHLADVKALRDRVQQALIYPLVLVVAGIALIIVFMTFMVPQLSGFFAETGKDLPMATKLLLSANHLIVGYWWVAVLVVGGAYALVKMFKRTPEGRRAWDAFLLRIPGYGLVMRYRYYAQFARTLGTLVENGVTLLTALELLEEISGNESIRQKMVEARRAVVDGASLSNALRPQKIFPDMFIDMMAVGEQTGRFGETMQMIADVFERELDKQVKVISALIPPLIMVAIAALVGLVVFGILSAVFNLTAGLRGRVR